jgi:hypothetical protein
MDSMEPPPCQDWQRLFSTSKAGANDDGTDGNSQPGGVRVRSAPNLPSTGALPSNQGDRCGELDNFQRKGTGEIAATEEAEAWDPSFPGSSTFKFPTAQQAQRLSSDWETWCEI